MKYLVGAVLLLAVPARAPAQCGHRCAPVIHHAPFVEKKVVVKKEVINVITTPFTPFVQTVALGVPSFSAVLNPPAAPLPVAPAGPYPGAAGAPAAVAPTGASNDAILAAIKQLDANVREIHLRVEKLEGPAPPSPEPRPPLKTPMPGAEDGADGPRASAVPADAFVTLAVKNCASCHEKGRENKGGGLVLLEGGQAAPLGREQVDEAMRRLALPEDDADTMPPGGHKMSGPDKLAMISALAARQSRTPGAALVTALRRR